MKKQVIYVVEALRFGDRDGHSYVVGAYSKISQANIAKAAEEAWRGGKYECVVTPFELDNIPEKKTDLLKN